MSTTPTNTISIWPILIFCITVTIYLFSPIITSTDSCFSTHIARSIIRQGNTNLNEIKNSILVIEKAAKIKFYNIEIINGNYYTIYPIGTPLLASPLVYILDKYFSYLQIPPEIINTTEEQIIASIYTALTAVFIYLCAQLLLRNKSKAIIISLIFAFSTSAWSTASRALWQHGPSMLMLSITLYLFLLARQKPWLVQYSSLPLAFSYVIRPTNSLSIIIFTALILIYYRKYFLKYCLWSLIIAIPFLIYNYSIYQAILPPYYFLKYQDNIFNTTSNYFQALKGTLISPSRGLFIFSPILLFCFYGIYLKIKQKNFLPLDWALIIIIILHWLTISTLYGWWGGFSYGPRLFTDMLPYLIYFIIPIFQYPFKTKSIKILIIIIFAVCTLTSTFIHFRGATSNSTWKWNFSPQSVDENPVRLWDWSDPQFLR